MSFSVPRCRRPICGSTRATTSPSSSSTSRSTPCAAGCCGPKLMVKLRRLCSLIEFANQPKANFRCFCSFATSLLIARQQIVRAFPWREEIEVAEFLIETDGFVEHPLLLIVVANLDEAGKREILAQRVALKAVVGQQPPHVRMTDEDHPVKIVGFALEPVGPWKHLDDRRDLSCLVGFRAQANAGVQRRRQQVIDHVEALLAPCV